MRGSGLSQEWAHWTNFDTKNCLDSGARTSSQLSGYLKNNTVEHISKSLIVGHDQEFLLVDLGFDLSKEFVVLQACCVLR